MHRQFGRVDGNSEVYYGEKYDPGQVFTNHVMSYWRGYNGGRTRSMVRKIPLGTGGLPHYLSGTVCRRMVANWKMFLKTRESATKTNHSGIQMDRG